MALTAAMTMLRVAVAVIVLGACTVEWNDGATSFGSAGMHTSGSEPGSDASSSGAAGSSEAEGGDEGPQTSSESGSTSDGSTTDPGASEATTEPESSGSSTGAPIGEHDYGPCTGGDPKAPCGEDAECLVIEGFEGSFCSPWCDEDLACPDPTSGEAFAQCQLGPDLSMDPIHCALLCTPGSEECPAGMTCVETGMPVGVCLFQG